MKSYNITKRFTTDKYGNEVLIIKIEHVLFKDKYKDRYLLFNSENSVFKKMKGEN